MDTKQLYPLKFNPILQERIWGGMKLKNILHKPTTSDKAGESWEISCVEGNISEVINGFLAGNDLEELIEVYMGDLIGDRIFDQYGTKFPLLIKFIDANDNLSIQVHPDDELAAARHNSFGKTEMWYIMQADEGAELIVGFNRDINKDIYLKHLNEKKLMSILNTEPVKNGDVFFLPARRVHAIGSGILLAEIQQTSDLTYRIYDFDRVDSNGKSRELHTELAVDSIDYTHQKNYRTDYRETENEPGLILSCPYFTTNKLKLSQKLPKDIAWLDCFVIYICVEGSCNILSDGNDVVSLSMGESLLIPASLTQYTIEPRASVDLLEVYIEKPASD
ncbi:MAG: class I mannose-6-phosphate isomerase [Bacteroidales bacterium]|nr:class I mannose-6-phosphate isomerase [Bacteroidales bacterium]